MPPRIASARMSLGSRAPHQQRFLLALLLLACSLVLGCHRTPGARAKDEARRGVLLPQDLQKERREAYEKVRLETEAGDLIPSESSVAGLTLPRGLSATFQLEHEWYFDGPLALPKLEKYFRERLEIQHERHPNDATLEFTGAIVRGNVLANPITLQLSPQPGRAGRSTIRIRELIATLPQGTPEQVRTQIAESKRYAH